MRTSVPFLLTSRTTSSYSLTTEKSYPQRSGPHLRTRFLAHVRTRKDPPFLSLTRARARALALLNTRMGRGGVRWVGWGGVGWGGIRASMARRKHRHCNLIILSFSLALPNTRMGWGGVGRRGTQPPTGQRDNGNGTTGQRDNGTTGQRHNGATWQRDNGTTGQRDTGQRDRQTEPNGTTGQRDNGTTG